MKNLFSLLVLLLLAQCAPRAVEMASQPINSAQNPPASSIISPPPPFTNMPKKDFRLRNGDNLYTIAKTENIPIEILVRFNNLSLKENSELRVGSVIAIPDVQAYVIQKGDNVIALARRFQTSADIIKELNGLQPPYNLRIDNKLYLPKTITTEPEKPTIAAPIQNFGGQNSQPLLTPAPLSSVEVKSLPNTMPNTKIDKSPADKPLEKAPTDKALPNLQIKSPIPPYLTQMNPIFNNGTAKFSDKRTLPPRSGAFVAPVKGQIIVNYGKYGDGLFNDGINFSAKDGSLVVAADNGEVAYIGNQIKGLGNLILIRHADGFVSAYAYLGRIMVAEGEIVKIGQAIAEVGASGSLSEPQLHFELRKNNQILDPNQFLIYNNG